MTEYTTHEPATGFRGAEMALCGAAALDPDAFDLAAVIVSEADFNDPRLECLWRALARVRQAGGDWGGDPILMLDQLRRQGDVDTFGGPAFLQEVFESVPHAVHVEFYARQVREERQRRDIIAAAEATIRAARSPAANIIDLVGDAEAKLQAVIKSHGGPSLVTMQKALTTYQEKITAGRQKGPDTGYAVLDEKGVVPAAGTVIIGARTGVGKSSLMVGIASNMARAGIPCLIFSLEMPAEQLSERFLCMGGNFPAWASRHPERADEVTRERVLVEMTRVGELPVWINDTAGLNVGSIAAISRVARHRHGIRAIFIDYVGIVRADDRRQPREQQVAGISLAIRELARMLQLPIFVLAQLNRTTDQKENKLPVLSSLRESGSLEMDADAVLLLHRPAANDPTANGREAYCVVAKNRGGPTGTVKLDWSGDQMTFRDPAPDIQDGYFGDDGEE